MNGTWSIDVPQGSGGPTTDWSLMLRNVRAFFTCMCASEPVVRVHLFSHACTLELSHAAHVCMHARMHAQIRMRTATPDTLVKESAGPGEARLDTRRPEARSCIRIIVISSVCAVSVHGRCMSEEGYGCGVYVSVCEQIDLTWWTV